MDDILKDTPSPSPEPSWTMPTTPSVTYNWVDITKDFVDACQDLELGELLHEPNFGLFEAMSAIEMMDPKMDAGMVGKLTKRQILDFKQSIKAKNIKISDLEYKDLIGIMDTCFCCLLSWLDGQSLAQTVFTCLYLHDPNLIEDRNLRAFSICLLKICDKIWDIINKGNVFEEEDFQTMTYGFKFATDVTDMRAVGMMKEVEEDFGRKLRSYKSNNDPNKEDAILFISQCNAVMARIKFLKLFLQILMIYGKKDIDIIIGLKKTLNQMTDCLHTIDRTTNLGVESVMSDDGHMLMTGFEPLVNQKLLPPTFPRYTTLRKQKDLKPMFEELLHRLHKVAEVAGHNSFKYALDFMKIYGEEVSCVFSRSVLQLTFMPENRRVFGKYLLTDYVRDAIRAFNAPPALSHKCPALHNHPVAKQHTDAFLARASRAVTCLMKVYGHNLARQREKLSAVLEDFSALQDDADRVDTELNGIYRSIDTGPDKNHLTCLGSWTLYHTLKIMIQYILSGFELELYSSHELHYIYWYLAEVLISWLVTTLNRAEAQLAKDDAIELVQKGRNSKKNKRNKKRAKIHSHELALMQGLQMLSAGCFKVILGFFISEKIKTPAFLLDNERTRYEHRFLPFVSVTTPPFMYYQQFKEMTDVHQYFPVPTAEDLYSSASKHFLQAKTVYENLTVQTDEIKSLTKIAKTNLVVTKLLAGGHKKESTKKPEFDFSVHKYFPVIKVL